MYRKFPLLYIMYSICSETMWEEVLHECRFLQWSRPPTADLTRPRPPTIADLTTFRKCSWPRLPTADLTRRKCSWPRPPTADLTRVKMFAANTAHRWPDTFRNMFATKTSHCWPQTFRKCFTSSRPPTAHTFRKCSHTLTLYFYFKSTPNWSVCFKTSI